MPVASTRDTRRMIALMTMSRRRQNGVSLSSGAGERVVIGGNGGMPIDVPSVADGGPGAARTGLSDVCRFSVSICCCGSSATGPAARCSAMLVGDGIFAHAESALAVARTAAGSMRRRSGSGCADLAGSPGAGEVGCSGPRGFPQDQQNRAPGSGTLPHERHDCCACNTGAPHFAQNLAPA